MGQNGRVARANAPIGRMDDRETVRIRWNHPTLNSRIAAKHLVCGGRLKRHPPCHALGLVPVSAGVGIEVGLMRGGATPRKAKPVLHHHGLLLDVQGKKSGALL